MEEGEALPHPPGPVPLWSGRSHQGSGQCAACAAPTTQHCPEGAALWSLAPPRWPRSLIQRAAGVSPCQRVEPGRHPPWPHSSRVDVSFLWGLRTVAVLVSGNRRTRTHLLAFLSREEERPVWPVLGPGSARGSRGAALHGRRKPRPPEPARMKVPLPPSWCAAVAISRCPWGVLLPGPRLQDGWAEVSARRPCLLSCPGAAQGHQAPARLLPGSLYSGDLWWTFEAPLEGTQPVIPEAAGQDHDFRK